MLRRNGIECEVALKASEVRAGAEGTSIVERILDGEVDLVLNTPAGSAGARHDGYDIRAAAVVADVAIMTTVHSYTNDQRVLDLCTGTGALGLAVAAEAHCMDSATVSDHFQPWRHEGGHRLHRRPGRYHTPRPPSHTKG